MLIVFPSAYGMCFGVKDALTKVNTLAAPGQATIWGELVHNPDVNSQLRERGFQLQSESGRDIPATPDVVVTAHGISNRQRQRLEEAGKTVHDTTCPLVRKVHRMAMHLHNRGYHIVVVGKPGHVEVEGLIGDLEHYTVVPGPAQARTIPTEKLAVLAQTTTPPFLFQETVARLKELHPDCEVKVVDTVCQPTRDRQEAMEQLIPRVDTVVVVGGRKSNNTLRLCELARQQGKRCYHVERAEELENRWFEGARVVGLTAGTSTPDDMIKQVYRRLLSFARGLRQAVTQRQALQIFPTRHLANRQLAAT